MASLLEFITPYSNENIDNDGKWRMEERTFTCYHCLFQWTGVPVPALANYDFKKQIFYAVGQFCSWPCAKTWMNERVSNQRHLSRLTLLAKKYFNYKKSTIPLVPTQIFFQQGLISKEKLKKYLHEGKSCNTLVPTLLPASLASVYGDNGTATQQILSTRELTAADESIGVRKDASMPEKKKSGATSVYSEFLKEKKGPESSGTETTVASEKSKSTRKKPARKTRSSLMKYVK